MATVLLTDFENFTITGPIVAGTYTTTWSGGNSFLGTAESSGTVGPGTDDVGISGFIRASDIAGFPTGTLISSVVCTCNHSMQNVVGGSGSFYFRHEASEFWNGGSDATSGTLLHSATHTKTVTQFPSGNPVTTVAQLAVLPLGWDLHFVSLANPYDVFTTVTSYTVLVTYEVQLWYYNPDTDNFQYATSDPGDPWELSTAPTSGPAGVVPSHGSTLGGD